MFFNKKREPLKYFIPENYIDIHSHILPGIDDGSKSIEDTLNYLSKLKDIGFKGLIPTPHVMNGVWDNSEQNIEETFNQTKNQLPRELDEMLIAYGAEYMVDFKFLNFIKENTPISPDGKHVLIEFSFMEAPQVIFDVISELRIQNYEIILAHPERYAYYHNNFILYEELKNYNVKFQMNLLSTVGYYGNNIAKIADQLLEKGYIDFTGSDIHHEGHINAFENAIIIRNTSQLIAAMQNNIQLSNEMIRG